MTTKMLRSSVYAVAVVIIVAIALLLGLWLHNRIGPAGGAEIFPISWFIIIAAVLGSVVNQPFRSRELLRSGAAAVVGYIAWKAAVAIVFAFLLYFMFIGGLIRGDMFPIFTNTSATSGGDYVSMQAFTTVVKPESYKDVAKLLVWSFIAGYSEKFVPNLVARLLGAAESSKPDDEA